MNTIEQQFRDEIEVEQLWVVTEHGRFVFFSMLLVSGLLVFGLWDSRPHPLLLFWLTLLSVVNFVKWMVLRYYHAHKDMLMSDVPYFKRLALLGALLTGLCWELYVVWFLQMEQPDNVLLICLTLAIEVVGAMLTWTCYLPAVIAIMLPIALPLAWLIFLQDGKAYLASALILVILTFLIITSSAMLAKVLNKALQLNFDNLALRRESEEKSILLETALENMNQGISMSDKDDRLRMWNRQFVQLLAVVGGKVTVDAKLADLFSATMPSLQVYSEGWTQFCLPNGQIYEIRQSILPQGGRVLTYTNISDLIKREQALEQARKEAEQANAAKTRFLAAASHDLRQPIHALGLFFAELSERVYSPETALVIGQVGDSIAAINSMLNALLDVSKLDAGIVQPVIEPVDLGELLSRLRAEFQPIALENHNELTVRPTTAIVNSDLNMLERMLRNLIANANRYTENGRILVAARPRGPNLIIQVIDTGIGIPEDQLDDIFIEFHQLQNPARDRQQGLGLGLAIVKRLSKLLHHPVKVTSRLGSGSCFAVTLPLARRPDTGASAARNTTVNLASNPLANRQVLVIDDDAAVLSGMQGLLTHWGCRVIAAAAPLEALALLTAQQQKIELLIIDYRLPDPISGIEAAGHLQQQLGYPFAVLVITGDTGPERLREADASGYPLLHKPVEPAKLRSALHYLLGSR